MNLFATIPIIKYRNTVAAASGILLGISLSGRSFWWCAWFALIPFFMVVRGLSVRESFKIGLVAGIAHFVVVINWVIVVLQLYAGMHLWQCFFFLFLFSTYLSLYLGLFSATIACFLKSPYEILLVAPASWVVFEFLRGVLFTGFPWGFIGYSQFEQKYIIQISDLFGVYGVSFLIVFFNASIYNLILFVFGNKWPRCIVSKKMLFKYFLFVLGILLLTFVYSYWRVRNIKQHLVEAETIKVGIIQGNVDQSIKWDPKFQRATVKKYIKLSKLLVPYDPDLIVWPETAMPFYFGCDYELTDFVTESIKDISTDFIIGCPVMVGNGSLFNSALLVDSNGKIQGRYDKAHLVPFGEYLPFRRLISLFSNFLVLPEDFTNGIPGGNIFWHSKHTQLGLQICYEIIFAPLSRLVTQNGAGVLVNLTNDAWFDCSNAAYQHFSMSVFRAIENRRALIRSANTGISAFVDPIGNILAETSIFQDEVLLTRLPLLGYRTIYTKYGDFFVLICVGIIVVAIFKHAIFY